VSSPPDLPEIPSAEGPLPGPGQLLGRPRALPVDLLGELHGPIFYSDFNGGFRKLYVCSLELVSELCDESRFAKNLTATLARVRPLAGDGLFTCYHGELNWQRAHDVLLPGFSYAGLRAYHRAMLDINCTLIERWDASVGVGPVGTRTVKREAVIRRPPIVPAFGRKGGERLEEERVVEERRESDIDAT